MKKPPGALSAVLGRLCCSMTMNGVLFSALVPFQLGGVEKEHDFCGIRPQKRRPSWKNTELGPWHRLLRQDKCERSSMSMAPIKHSPGAVFLKYHAAEKKNTIQTVSSKVAQYNAACFSKRLNQSQLFMVFLRNLLSQRQSSFSNSPWWEHFPS